MIVEAHGWLAVFGVVKEDFTHGLEMKRVACWQEYSGMGGKVSGLVDWDDGRGLVVADGIDEFIAYVKDVDITTRIIAILKHQFAVRIA